MDYNDVKIIETERLLLRPFAVKDYDDLFEFLSQRRDDIYEGYPGINYENGQKHLKYRLGSNEFYAMESKDTHKVIGNIYFGERDFEARETGYIVNKNYQRQGYATEAIKAVVKEGFLNGVHRIYAECDPNNECSWRLLESLGFAREAFFKQNVFFRKDDKDQPIWQDTYVYSLLNDQ